MHTDAAVHAGFAGDRRLRAGPGSSDCVCESDALVGRWPEFHGVWADAWSNNVLSFNVVPGTGANGLQVMIPMDAASVHLSAISLNGSSVSFTVKSIKGVSYTFVAAGIGQYQIVYVP